MSDTKKTQRAKNRRRRLKAKGRSPLRRRRSTKQHLFQIAVVVIALLCFKKFNKSPIICKDPSDPLCPDAYFNDNYTDARAQFLALSATINSANTYNLPIYELKTGTHLYTDVTVINENSKSNHLIIHIAGTHGIEGHAGSAIQLSLLEYISNITNNQKISKLFENYTFTNDEQCNDNENGPIIMFVHAFNPFGFHFRRRVNENNVDLNRNFKSKSEWDELVSMPKNAFGYQDLNSVFNPKYDFKSILNTKVSKYYLMTYYYWTQFLRFPYYIATVGMKQMKRAMVTGQWFEPKGLQYNGVPYKLEKSHAMLEDFILNQMFEQRHSEWKGQITKISFIDVHTGLGKYGWDTLIGNYANDVKKLKALMSEHSTKGLIVSSRGFDGYENVNGYLTDQIQNLVELKLKGDSNEGMIDTLACVQEFGTFAETWILAAMRFENGMTNAYSEYVEKGGSVSGEMEEVMDMTKKRMKEVFYVKRVDWKRDIVQRGFNLFAQIFNR